MVDILFVTFTFRLSFQTFTISKRLVLDIFRKATSTKAMRENLILKIAEIHNETEECIILSDLMFFAEGNSGAAETTATPADRYNNAIRKIDPQTGKTTKTLMKNKTHQILFLLAFLTLGCASNKHINPSGTTVDLLDRKDWKIDTLRKDVIWYQYNSTNDPEFASQNVNVLSFDPKLKLGKALLAYKKEKDSLSTFASRIPEAIAGINATYFLEKKDSADYMHLRLKAKG